MKTKPPAINGFGLGTADDQVLIVNLTRRAMSMREAKLLMQWLAKVTNPKRANEKKGTRPNQPTAVYGRRSRGDLRGSATD